jgi:FkbM family methyltransferase
VRRAVVRLIRRLIPISAKRLLYKLSLAPEVEGGMFFHINLLRVAGYRPDLVVDVGAYVGEWTKQVLPIFPNAHFVMFEPQEDKQAALGELARSHDNVECVQTLLGKGTKAEVTFYEMETGSSIYEERTTHPRRVRTYPMQTLDEALGNVSVTGAVFLKLDVQGAERDVLDGAVETLQRCEFILLEASLLDFNTDAPLLDELVVYLRDRGFVVYDVCDMRRKPNGTLFQVDLLFSRVDGAVRLRENHFSS